MQLQLWLSQRNNSQFDQIYRPVLQEIFYVTYDETDGRSDLDGEDKNQLIDILGSICVLSSPLSVPTLAVLLAIDKDDVDRWVQNLYAVLNVPRTNQDPPLDCKP